MVVQHEAITHRTDEHQVLLPMVHELRERDGTAIVHRGHEQLVRLLGARLRPEVVRALEVQRVDAREGHELVDVDVAARLRLDGLQLLVQ
jgi:hypothetical protein